MKSKILSLIIVLISITGINAQTVSPDYQDGIIYFKVNYEKGVEFKVNEDLSVNPTEFPTLKEIFKKYGVISLTRPFYLFGNKDLLNTIRAEFTKIHEVNALIEALHSQDIIVFAEKVPLEKILWTPNDPYYNTINGKNYRWYLDMIKADSAWNVQHGTANIKVAIIDNFVWGAHPDLQIQTQNLCKFTSSTNYTLGTASPSSSIPQGSTSTAYSASHGTHCAGLVGAINNNNVGIASIGGGITLMGVGVGKESSPSYISYGNEGIQWAANNGANVISMSYGSAAYSSTSATLLQACYNAGIVLVAAAGNEGDEGNEISYPGGYSTVISVASVDGDGKLSYFSQWGPGRADIAAPGGFISSTTYPNILSTTYCKSYIFGYYYSSTFANTYYDGMQGTSMACPIVAGLCGLLLSKDSTLSSQQIKTRLQQTAIPLNSASSHTIDGYGYINAYEALGYEYLLVSDTSILFSSTANQTRNFTIESTVNWSITNIPSWLSVNPTSGTAGISNVTISTLNDNEGSSNMIGQITINGSENIGNKYLQVVQTNYMLTIQATPKYTLLQGIKGASDTFYIASNLNWEIINESAWLGLNKTSGNGNDTIIFSAKSANTWGSNRVCTLIVKALSFSNDTIIIEQRIPDFIKLDALTDSIDAQIGSAVTVDLFTNVDWTISGGQDWLSLNVTSGSDSAQLVFTALSDNTTGSNRISTYNISNGPISRTLMIVQKSNVSINEPSMESEILLYPNPVSDKLSIKTSNINTQIIEITDIMGKVIGKFEPKEAFQIDVSAYANGIYIVKLKTDNNNTIYKKFIKQ